MTALIFDTETTGHKEDPGLIEAAGIGLPGPSIDLRPMGQFDERFNPGKPSTLGALATHHILDSELADCPPASTFALPDGVEYLIGHNVDYDWQVIGKPDVKRICTLVLARKAWPALDSHKLGALAYHVVPPEQARQLLREAHSALSDCETTRFLLLHIIKALRCPDWPLRTWSELYWCCEDARVPTHMPFGKHKGQAIADLPHDYIDWFTTKSDMASDADRDPYLWQALTRRRG